MEIKKGANNHFAPQTQTIINQRNIIRMITFPAAKLRINYTDANYQQKNIKKFTNMAFLRINVSVSLVCVPKHFYFLLYPPLQ